MQSLGPFTDGIVKILKAAACACIEPFPEWSYEQAAKDLAVCQTGATAGERVETKIMLPRKQKAGTEDAAPAQLVRSADENFRSKGHCATPIVKMH